MTEQQIQDLLKEEKWINLVKKLKQIYPNGFDIEKIDKRIKDKLNQLGHKDYNIEKPIQLRKK